jgi:hypothetical protein
LCITFGIASCGWLKVPGELVIIMLFISVALPRRGCAGFLIDIARPVTNEPMTGFWYPASANCSQPLRLHLCTFIPGKRA